MIIVLQSPPSRCPFYKWIDMEQSSYHTQEVEWEVGYARRRMLDKQQDEERKEKMRLFREKERLEKEKNEREEKANHDAERARKREIARHAQEEEEAGKCKGKYPVGLNRVSNIDVITGIG